MGLNILKYIEEFKPHIAHRFSVEFESYPELNLCVKTFKPPQIKIDGDIGRKRFGSTEFTIPVYSFGEQTVEIEFEDTENLDAMRAIHGMSRNMTSVPTSTTVIVYEYDSTFNKIISKKRYTIRLKEYDNAGYSYGGSPSILEFSTTFIVDDVEDLLVEKPEVITLNPMAQQFEKSLVADYSIAPAEYSKSLLGLYGIEDDAGEEDYKKVRDQLEKKEKDAAAKAKKNYEALDKEWQAREKEKDEQRNKEAEANAGKEHSKKAEQQAEPAKTTGDNNMKPSKSKSNPGVTGTYQGLGSVDLHYDPNKFNKLASDAYQKEMQSEGAFDQVFYDINDQGKQAGAVNLGSGSAMKARDYSSIGPIDVTVDGKSLHFNSVDSFNNAMSKAIGGDKLKELNARYKKASKSERKAIMAEMKSLAGTLKDDKGNTAQVKFTGKMGYVNVKISQKDVEEIRGVNSAIDTKWGENVKAIIANNASDGNNIVLKKLEHLVHGATAGNNVIQSIGKDPEALKILADAVKQNKITKELADVLYKKTNSSLKGKGKTGVAKVIASQFEATGSANKDAARTAYAKQRLAEVAVA